MEMVILPPIQSFLSEDIKLSSRSSSLSDLEDGFNFVQLSDLMANSNKSEHKHLYPL